MLPSEFDQEMERLVLYYQPTKQKWNGKIKSEFSRAFTQWSYERFKMAATACIEDSVFFPRISELRKYGKADEIPERGEKEELVGCDHCAMGRINFEVVRKDIPYERYLACDCEAGDAVMLHIQMMARVQRITVPDEMKCRYSYFFDAHGGLSTAKNGVGYGLEPGNIKAVAL